MTSARRNENIDSFRGLLVLTVFLGHANLFFNAYRPYFRNEGGLFLVPWEHYSDGIIRMFLHPVAAAFIGLAGYTADRFLASKPNSFLVTRGLTLILLDLTAVSFAFYLAGFGAAPAFGALSATGFGLLIMPLVRKLSLRMIAGAIVALKLAAILLPFTFLAQYQLPRAFFYFYFGRYFYVLYAPLGWVIVFLAGVAVSRMRKEPNLWAKLVKPGLKRDLVLVVLALGLAAALQKIFLRHNPQLSSFFQSEHYPAGNAYLMFSLAWIIALYNLARAVSKPAMVRKFLGHLARHGLAYYLFHLYVFGVINRLFQIKSAGTFATGFSFFMAFAGCILVVAAVQDWRHQRNLA